MITTTIEKKDSQDGFFRKNKTAINFAVKILIAAGMLFYLASSIEYGKIVSAIENANLLLIALAFLLSFINIYLQYSKWRLTCGQVLEEKKKSKILTSLFYGFSTGTITPLRVGEYFGRAIVFKNKSLIQVTIATLIDKFFPLMIVAFVGSVTSILFFFFYYNTSIYLTLSLFIVLFTLFYFFAMLLLSRRFWDSIFFSRIKKIKHFKSVIEKLQVLKSLDRRYFYRMSIISLLFYFCFLLQLAILVSAFSHNYSFINYIWAGNLIMFAKTIIPPISLGELGIREGASIYFLTQFGETASAAFNASIFLFIINLLIPALVGLVLLLKRNDT